MDVTKEFWVLNHFASRTEIGPNYSLTSKFQSRHAYNAITTIPQRSQEMHNVPAILITPR
jgi:hypothetical protein